MRTIYTVVRCDVCAEEIEEPGSSETRIELALNGETHRARVDLCLSCQDVWVQDLAPLVEVSLPWDKPKPVITAATRARQAKPKGMVVQDAWQTASGMYACPEPGCSVLSTKSGLGTHLTRGGHWPTA